LKDLLTTWSGGKPSFCPSSNKRHYAEMFT